MGVVCCLLVCGCAATPDTTVLPASYVVRPQDTLYGIAWRHNLDYRELAKWNNIGPDYKLSVGQVLALQPVAGRSASLGPPPTYSLPARLAGAATAPRVGQPRPWSDTSAAGGNGAAGGSPIGGGAARASGTTANASGGVNAAGGAPALGGGAAMPDAAGGGVAGNWVWPTDRVSAPRPVPGGGILVLGHLGQDVRAASSGRIVYTGSGLRGYGNLIIIKHGDNLLSSYAHNRELTVHEGQEVSAGQVIGHMGYGPHQISALYFEIRVNGKPVDPLRYLARSR